VSSFLDFPGVKIGCVQYLNAKPLIYGHEDGVRFDHPSKLAADLSRGALDVALVPVIELFRNPQYLVVDGVSISSFGPVFSVFLAYRGELGEVREVALDPRSLTSSHLLRCLLREFHQIDPRGDSEADARLLIGNQAIAFRRQHGDHYRYFDLGEEWTFRTGLPFVYALWLVRPGTANAAAIAARLRSLKKTGTAQITEIAKTHDLGATFVEHYLRSNIRYDFGDAEKAGLELFHQMIVRNGFLENSDFAPEFI
jgi:chorismate dehydratase